ncbi:MAG: segregation/condensation protein A [Oscillospiraceae bacterium]|nr:segregation/condensation protein A [Oscillospiraceae bacterium]
MEKLLFKVADYDAPMELILHLISTHKLKITDIGITSLLDQYMMIIESWQSEDMEIASGFLEMASRLVHMKTVGLLPRHEEESERLRRAFEGELMEYQICRLAAARLGESLSMDAFVREPVEFEIDHTYTGSHPAGVLFEALRDAAGRGARRMPPPRESFDPIVAAPVVTVTAKIFAVLRALRKLGSGGSLSMKRLFSPELGRSGLVATFLAVLELMRSGKIHMRGNKISLQGDKPS